MKEIKPYVINFVKNENLQKAMHFLFSKGLVFTDGRIRNTLEMRSKFFDFAEWHWIYICHDPECKRVMNTSKIVYRGYLVHRISFKEFVKEVLPQL